MTSLEQAIDLIGRLTRGEKARLVRDIVSQLDEIFPGIDTLPDVCDSDFVALATRIDAAVRGNPSVAGTLMRVNRQY